MFNSFRAETCAWKDGKAPLQYTFISCVFFKECIPIGVSCERPHCQNVEEIPLVLRLLLWHSTPAYCDLTVGDWLHSERQDRRCDKGQEIKVCLSL